jgi:hypothetical protein
MTSTTRSGLFPRLFIACLIFTAGFAAGSWYPSLKALFPEVTVPPANLPGKPAGREESPEQEARHVLEQLGKRVRDLQAREQTLQRSLKEDQVAVQILRSQGRCEDDEACRRLEARRQRTDEELRDLRQQTEALKEVEQRVLQVADRIDEPREEQIDPALVAARALLLRTGDLGGRSDKEKK